MYTLFVTRGYPTEKYKTYGIFEFDQAKALVAKNQMVVYISLDLRSVRRWRQWGLKREVLDGVHIFSISIPLGRVGKKTLEYFYIKNLKKLFKIIVSEFGLPSLIHAHFYQYGYFASLLKKEYNIPLIITEHSEEMNRRSTDINSYAF